MSGFEVQKEQKDEIAVLHLCGFLDAHTVPIFEQALQELVDNQQYKIVINFSDLDYISSAGLGVFMGYIEEIRANDGDIKLCRLSARVYKVFDLLGFPALFQIFDSEEEALQSF